MYDAQLGRWHVPDPLDENEYDREMENTFNEEFGFSLSDDQMTGNQTEELSDVMKFSNRLAFLFSPKNVIDPETSAVHYNSSPYAYVLNNPLKYRDLFGLDTAQAPIVLPTLTVTAPREESSGPPHWLGPSMIIAGQPWLPKRFVTPGSSPGTSIASKVLNKVIPINSPKPLPTIVINRSGTRLVFTKAIGKFLGRWVPFVGWGLTAYDFTQGVVVPMSQSAAEYHESNVKSGNWINNLPH